MADIADFVPAPNALIDFTTDTATVSGSGAAIGTLFASDPSWSAFDTGDIVAGEGYVGPSGGGGGKFAGSLLTLVQGFTTYVVMCEITLPSTGAPTFEFTNYEDPGFSTEFYLTASALGCEFRQNHLPIQSYIPFDGMSANDSYASASLRIGRLAMLITPEVAACGIIGKGIGAMEKVVVDPVDTWTFVCGENVRLRRLAVWGGAAVGDLLTFQMITAMGPPA